MIDPYFDLSGDEAPVSSHASALRILVVDDDPEVHAVTRLALDRCRYADRPLEIISARSAAEARALLAEDGGIALMLLDVVMETDHAGLDLVRYVREALGNRLMRIALLTGHAGQAPPREIVERFEIDDYRTKTELTLERLHILVMTAMRSYMLLTDIEGQREALLAANRELEHFTYVASHDLQTPLRAIVGFAQLLKLSIGATLDPATAEMLDQIADSGKRLHELIANLLNFARVGRAHQERIDVELAAVVRNALHTLESIARQRGARLEIGDLPRVHGDEELLVQLFRNLIENALRYQPGEQPLVRISAEDDGGEWIVRVTDQGIGIERQFLEKVFEPFQRLHTHDEFPGTGLGLAIARRAALRLGGSLSAESMPGQGTTMVLRLPKLR